MAKICVSCRKRPTQEALVRCEFCKGQLVEEEDARKPMAPLARLSKDEAKEIARQLLGIGAFWLAVAGLIVGPLGFWAARTFLLKPYLRHEVQLVRNDVSYGQKSHAARR